VLIQVASNLINNKIVYSISLQRVLVASYCYIVPSSPILVTLMMEALHSSETPVVTTATWRNISEDGIHHSHSRENLKSEMK
jgi:hypothetical protein